MPDLTPCLTAESERASLVLAQEALQAVLRQFTRTPSTTQDTEVLNQAYAAELRLRSVLQSQHSAQARSTDTMQEGQPSKPSPGVSAPHTQPSLPVAMVEPSPRSPDGFHFRDIEGRMKWLRFGDLLYAHASEPHPALEPVHGDVLPPVGSRVFIRHGRDDQAHACIVTGYYAYPDLGGNTGLHRVSVRMVYEGTQIPQARCLRECYASEEAALAA